MKNSYQFIVSNILFLMILIVILITVTGCSKTLKSANNELGSGVPNYGAIADVLGCMFAPDTCPTKDEDTEANTEQDNKDWDEVK